MTRSNLYKNGLVHALRANASLVASVGDLAEAEEALKNSGYRRAAVGIHQAMARVISWQSKLAREINALEAEKKATK